MITSAIYGKTSACCGSGRRNSARPSIVSIKSQYSTRGIQQQHSISGSSKHSSIPRLSIMETETADVLIEQKEGKTVLTSLFGYDFRYRKSIFATLFAVLTIATILFIMLYLRCFNFYMESEKEKESLKSIYRPCELCPLNSYCSNENGRFKCQCKRGFYMVDNTCKDVSYSFFLSQNTSADRMKFKLKTTKLISEMSFCFWMRPSSDQVNVHLRKPESTNIFRTRGASASINDTSLSITWSEKNYHISLHLAMAQWTHLCVTMSKHVTAYVNGQQTRKSYGNGSLNLKFRFSNSDLLYFGMKDKRGLFNGEISQFYLISKTLTRDEILNRDWLKYDSSSLQDSKVLLSWWNILEHGKKYLLPMVYIVF